MANLLKRIKSSYRLIKYGLHAPKLRPESIYQQYNAQILDLKESSSLDLGCGNNPRNPFGASKAFGIDLFDQKITNVKVADLSIEPIPFESESLNYITAFDFIEHIPRILYCPQRTFPFVQLMSEIYRCLKPGGYFFSHTPAYPYSPLFRDPTHVNYITEETFGIYFDTQHGYAKNYGFRGGFNVLAEGWDGFTLISLLQKPLKATGTD